MQRQEHKKVTAEPTEVIVYSFHTHNVHALSDFGLF